MVCVFLIALALLPGTARADDWRRGPTDPLYLALGLRGGIGPAFGSGGTAAEGSFLISGRVAGSFGDGGIGIVLRGGVDLVSAAVDYRTPGGAYPHADGWLAGFGMGTRSGFFERGAYIGAGLGIDIGQFSVGVTIHHPLLRIAEGWYLGADLTCMIGLIATASSVSGSAGGGGRVQIGLELAAFD